MEDKRMKTGAPIEATHRVRESAVGDMLKEARLQKGLDFEEISAAIHIRGAQLRAIEEGNISSLPGMTYAIGFVKSYATYLKLNPAEVVQRFKAEHGTAAPSTPKTTMAEPIRESRLPNAAILGVGAFSAVVLLLLWAVFSSDKPATINTAANIPPPPPVESSSTSLADSLPPPNPSTQTHSAIQVTDAPAVSKLDNLAGTSLLQPVPPSPTAAPIAIATPIDAASKEADKKAKGKDELKKEETKGEKEQATPDDKNKQAAKEKDKAKDKADIVWNEETKRQGQNQPIRVSRTKSRIVLAANAPVWVEITDQNQNTILKKVIRPGEQFFVPDQEGLEMITTNAGGLDVTVDGASVQSLGGKGEIIRGIALNPEQMKIAKVRTKRE